MMKASMCPSRRKMITSRRRSRKRSKEIEIGSSGRDLKETGTDSRTSKGGTEKTMTIGEERTTRRGRRIVRR